MPKSLLLSAQEIAREGEHFGNWDCPPKYLSAVWRVCRSLVLAIDAGYETANEIANATGYGRSTVSAYLGGLEKSGFPIRSELIPKASSLGGRPHKKYSIEATEIKFIMQNRRFLKSEFPAAPHHDCKSARVNLKQSEWDEIQAFCLERDISRNALGMLAMERIATRQLLTVVRYARPTAHDFDKFFVLKAYPSLYSACAKVLDAENRRLKTAESIGSAVRHELLTLLEPKHTKFVLAKIQDADERVMA
jgi:hypothetical protein